ncbi:MAG: glycine dehydrogenase, partial [Thermodesulfobacteriota bacterium]
LCALMATVFLSCLGKEGLKELALMNLSKAEYAKKAVSRIRGCKLNFSGPTFNEFVIEIEKSLNGLCRDCRKRRFWVVSR